MMQLAPGRVAAASAIIRLSRLARLGDEAIDAIRRAATVARRERARRELVTEGRAIDEPQLLLAGWLARVRILSDGRRQFLSFILPGDLINISRQARPVAVTTVVALTDAVICPAPAAPPGTPLAEAYAVSAALEEAHLLAQITRLGRLTAQERIGDLFLELHDRLALADLVSGGAFNFPLTQEILGDALGLTAVHINRMIQQMRMAGDVEWKAGRVGIRDIDGLAKRLGRRPVRVTSERV